MENAPSNPILKVKSKVGHLLREGLVHLNSSFQIKQSQSIIFCVDDLNNGMSSGLRGYKLAEGLKKRGWHTIVIPKQLELHQRQRIIQREKPTYVYLQQTRHPHNRPNLFDSNKCILDVDDADFLDTRQTENVNRCMRDSFGVIAGSRFIRDYALTKNTRCEIVWTGAPVRNHGNITKKAFPPAIAWACSNPLGYPNEANFVRDLIGIIDKSINFQFWLIGAKDDESTRRFLEPLINNNISYQIYPFMPYSKLLDQLEKATIGLAPTLPELSSFSAGKSFGKVLAYLNSRIAVVASNNVDHPLFFHHGLNGYLATSLNEWKFFVELLLTDKVNQKKVAWEGNAAFIRDLSTESMATRVDLILRSWLNKP